MKRVGFGFLGTKLDAMGGFGEKRLATWRPTISFATDDGLGLSCIELWYSPSHQRLAELIKRDIEAHPTAAKVNLREIVIRDPWNFEEVYGFLYDFANGYSFNPDEEEYFVHLTTGTHVAQICLFLLTETRHFPAKIVQTNPRSEGRKEPSFTVVDLDLSQYDRLAQRFEKKLADDLQILKRGINTRNQKFNEMIREIEQVARASVEPILLLGPTGAGKSHLAKQIYLLKSGHHQVSGEFVDVNCATLRGEQAMSTLFGHAKGAFTGAAAKRDGLLKRANGGVLFLDEVGELGLDEQAMLLRALEEKRFLPLGSDNEEESDFQLIAGTNRDLSGRVAQGFFREDLLRRIDTWCFTMPALRDRREDIEPNLEFELLKFEQRAGRRASFSAEAKARYLEYALSPAATWPGNFRDLNASVIRMATLAPQGRITMECVSREIKRLQKTNSPPAGSSSCSSNDDSILLELGIASNSIDRLDRVQLAEVVKVVRESDSIAAAGRTLFNVSREGRSANDSDRLRKYLARFGLDARRLTRGE